MHDENCRREITRVALSQRTMSHLKLRIRAATKGWAAMNGTGKRLTTLEILTIFILTVFFFMGCTAARQPTLESAPPSFAPGQATSPQIEASDTHATAQPSLDWGDDR
jgi:hypothetical protein